MHDWIVDSYSWNTKEYAGGFRWWTCSRCGYSTLHDRQPDPSRLVRYDRGSEDTDTGELVSCEERVTLSVMDG